MGLSAHLRSRAGDFPEKPQPGIPLEHLFQLCSGSHYRCPDRVQ
jgi:hypothetical protein